MKMKTSTRLTLGFGVQLLLAGVLGISVLVGMADVQRQFRVVVEHDAPIIANAEHLSKLMVDMETGQRGFVITGREEFLEPYNSGAKEFYALCEEEMKLVRDDPGQVAALKRIEGLVHAWLEKAAEPEIAMARKVATHVIDAEHLQKVLARGAGKRLMDSIMALGHEIKVSFSERGDWEGAFAVEIIEKSMAGREDGQRGFLITGQEEFLDKYSAGEQTDLPRYFSRLRAIVSERGRDAELSERIDQLEQLTRDWSKESGKLEIAARREMNKHPVTLKDVAALLQAGTGKDLVDEIRRELDQFIEIEETHAAQRYAAATRTAARTRNTAAALLVLAIGLGIAAALVTSRAITNPLARLVRGAQRVGSGDLETRVEPGSSDEFGDLAHAFNAMVSRLAEAATRRDQLEGQLVLAQKMESIGQLAAGIAHEINTPTQYVGDNTRFIRDRVEDLLKLADQHIALLACAKDGSVQPELIAELESEIEELDLEFVKREIPKAIEQTLEGVGRAAEIVRAMKNFSHPGTQEKTPTDLNRAIESTITVCCNRWKYVADLETDFENDLPMVPCLVGEFNQVILNVIVNAADAIGEFGGDEDEDKGRITVSTRQDGEWVEIRVSDTGGGIPEQIQQKIFDPFFTTKQVGKGTGQGLSICHDVIVNKHGGTIDFVVEPGMGTTFVIRLPIAEQGAMEQRGAA